MAGGVAVGGGVAGTGVVGAPGTGVGAAGAGAGLVVAPGTGVLAVRLIVLVVAGANCLTVYFLSFARADATTSL